MKFAKFVALVGLACTISAVSVSAQVDGNASSVNETKSGAVPVKALANRDPGSSKTSSNASNREGTPIPEPSNLGMLALGIAGLVAGRYAARKHRDRP